MFIVIIVLVVRILPRHPVLTEHRELHIKNVVVEKHHLASVINVRLIIARILVRVVHMNQVQIVVMAHPVRHIKHAVVVQVTIPQLVTLVTHLRILTTIIVRPVISVAPEW